MNRRSRDAYYTIWTAIIMVCLALAVFAAFLPSCTKASSSGTAKDVQVQEETEDDAVPAEDATSQEDAAPEEDVTSEEDTASGDDAAGEDTSTEDTQAEDTAADDTEEAQAPFSVILGETADQGDAYIDQFVFLGDSTTYGLAAYGVLPKTQVWTPESGTMTLSNQSADYIVYYEEDGSSEKLTIREAVAQRKPEYLVITLGLNGISFMTEDSFNEQYVDLINTIHEASPDTKIICQSIFPVIDSLVSADIGNQRIDTANDWIVEIAEETGTRYLNTHETLVDEAGDLRTEYNNGDGIHLSYEGGEAVLEYVRTHAYQ